MTPLTPIQAKVTKGARRQFAQLLDARGGVFITMSPNIWRLEEFEARVGEIVQAVNSHAALVEALQRTLSWMTSYPGEGAMGAYEQAREALRLAQPENGG